MNQAGTAAHGAVFHIFLMGACCQVDGHDDFFAAVVTNVAGFFVHSLVSSLSSQAASTSVANRRFRGRRNHGSPDDIDCFAAAQRSERLNLCYWMLCGVPRLWPVALAFRRWRSTPSTGGQNDSLNDMALSLCGMIHGICSWRCRSSENSGCPRCDGSRLRRLRIGDETETR